MQYTIPSVILISMLALSACTDPPQRYSAGGKADSNPSTVDPAAPGPQNKPGVKGSMGAGTAAPVAPAPAN